MIRLRKSNEQPHKPFSAQQVVVFAVDAADGPECVADYFATPKDKPYGDTQLALAFSVIHPDAKIEELRLLLERRLCEFSGSVTWFVEIASAVTVELQDYSVIAHSSYVPD